MLSFVEYAYYFIFIAALIFVFFRRLKHSDYAFMAEKSDVVLPALGSGFLIGILVAIFYVLVAVETNRFEKINWFLVVGGIAIVGGGIVGLIIQVATALPAKLWRRIARK